MTSPENGSSTERRRFSDSTLAKYEKVLRAARQRDAKSYREALAALQHGDDSPELFDQAMNEQDHDVNTELAESSERVIMEIDAALSRIREKTYGICTRCRKAIPRERLNAIPYATECVPCKATSSGDRYAPMNGESNWDRVAIAEREVRQHYGEPEMMPIGRR
jgi:DnaK suppressor protein